MNYKLIEGTCPAVEITLNRGESVKTQSGGMSWMSSGMKMETSTGGGLKKGLLRTLAGESLFQTNYVAQGDGEIIGIGAGLPGSIYVLELDGTREFIAQKEAFLAAEQGVNMDTVTVKSLSGALFGGEGIFLLKFSGVGTAFLEVGGQLIEKDLAPGEVLYVDTGNVVFYESSVNYEAEMVKGAKNMLFGGEGLVNTKLTGPGKVCLQTMNVKELSMLVYKFIPKQQG